MMPLSLIFFLFPQEAQAEEAQADQIKNLPHGGN